MQAARRCSGVCPPAGPLSAARGSACQQSSPRTSSALSSTIKAVDGVDLDVPEGQIFGYLGQNGSGKTTTVRMLTTLLKPTSGRAEVNGIDVRRHPGHVRRTIGVALQEAGLDELQTGRELLELQAALFGMRGRKGHERAAELLRIVDLEEAADRRIGGLLRRDATAARPRGCARAPAEGRCFSTSRRPGSTP